MDDACISHLRSHVSEVPRNLNKVKVLADELLRLDGKREDVRLMKSMCISVDLRALSLRLFQLHQEASY